MNIERNQFHEQEFGISHNFFDRPYNSHFSYIHNTNINPEVLWILNTADTKHERIAFSMHMKLFKKFPIKKFRKL